MSQTFLLVLATICLSFTSISEATPVAESLSMIELGASKSGRTYYASNRLVTQIEAPRTCREFGYAPATIQCVEESDDIVRFLEGRDYPAVWTDGVAGNFEKFDYKWKSLKTNVNYTNWVDDIAPQKSDYENNSQGWKDSGIALIRYDWQWALRSNQDLYPALCQSNPPTC